MWRASTIAILFMCFLLEMNSAWGRGFGGGFHGGGFGGGGGFHGGGFGGGGFSGRGGFSSYRGGNMGGQMRGYRGGNMGGYRGNQFGGISNRGGGNMGGYRGNQFGGISNRGGGGEFGARSGGGARPAQFAGGGTGASRTGAAPSRMQMNQFLGLPSDAGMHSAANSRSVGDFNVSRGIAEGPRGGTAAGTAVTGPHGNTVARGGAVGPDGGVAAGRAVEGAGGTAVARGAAVGPDGRVAAGTVARGPEGGVAARGIAAGPEGAAAGFAYRSPAGRYDAAYGVRAGYVGTGLYSPAWYTAHPGAWAAAGLTASAWAAADWASLDGWCAMNSQPVYYDYGSNVVTEGDNVYVNNEDAGTTQQYYQQAADLADAGEQNAPADDSQWLPLGVFAMTPADKSDKNMVIQLAVDKSGTIRGNFTDTDKNETLPVQGSVDKKSQRAAWTIGDKKGNVIETGIYNLTKQEVPALVHLGPNQTQQWLLVRLKQPTTK